MVSIPGFVFMIVGIITIYTSYSIGARMNMFFYLGILFLVYGSFKQALSIILAKRERKREMGSNKEGYTEGYTRNITKQVQKPGVIYCPQCRTAVYASSNFCPKCGFKLRGGKQEVSR